MANLSVCQHLQMAPNERCREYLHKVLDVFNFKQDFKRWVKVFHTDISSCVTNNGFASLFFTLNAE